MTIELRTETTALAYQIEEARALAAGSMLPDAYRNQPANILIAMNLGAAMGLSPAESLYRISVIKGKPTASAELIASNVRKAGHRLRVVTDEQAVSATATIVRADDPEFEFAVTRDMAWAKSMNLATNDNYRKQPLTMLANRAITACARLACPETLYGVAYTPDEMIDMGTAEPPRRGLAAVLNDPSPAQDDAPSEPPAPPATGHADEGDRHGQASAGEVSTVTKAQLSKMGAAMRERGITERADALDFVRDAIGRDVASRNELTKDEAGRVIDALEAPYDEPVDGELLPEDAS